MPLTTCVDCGYPLSYGARKCPRCQCEDPTSITTKALYWSLDKLFEAVGRIIKAVVKDIRNLLKGKVTNYKGEVVFDAQAEKANREGNNSLDLHYTISVSYLDLINGCENTYEIDGKNYRVKIPKDSKVGMKLRLKGLGKQKAGEIGDVFLELVLLDIED